ncbi:MAG TPA: MupA/Atu3671 family FMN-dependent luciferase-like monooxygenase [Roseiflexaceae bacterium]|nr:MupA/Atu3671 family FMN-dependent luciferase-like monooxygenase [Roseiflexaceae bacterium]
MSSTDIAIIGLAGRFPGAAQADDFWKNIAGQVESIVMRPTAGGERSPRFVPAVAMLEDYEWFDADFFSVHPREAELMDPQHRALLECAYTALEDAGYAGAHNGAIVGVYVGAGVNTYLLYHLGEQFVATGLDQMQINLGNAQDFLATRISYKLNLQGPSVTVQTACSTSLVAIHMACQSLLDRECDLALAGGVAINPTSAAGYWYQEGGITSPDGHCRTFDAQAQGTVFGSGAGVVVLKRLADALDDRDTIHAVIKGSAINNDGALKVGYTAPSVEGQAAVIAEALAVAGVDARTIGYVEAHGTATPLGDPIEITALTKAFRAQTEQRGFCAIGSVKSNIGHLDVAAGVAGLIKTVLALRHGQLPPSLHFRTPNPQIDFAQTPFYVNAALAPWPASSAPRRAGVSSFGIGGTNAHVILEEAPAPRPPAPARPSELLVLSARSPAALAAAAERLAQHLQAHPALPLADVASTLQTGRRAFAHRLAFVCRTAAEAVEILRDPASPRRMLSTVEPQRRPVAWLFPGQGAQHVGMGADLYAQEPAFRDALDRCAALLTPLLGLDIRTLIFAEPEAESTKDTKGTNGSEHGNAKLKTQNSKLTETVLAQPALFAVEYALAQLWLARGVVPQALLGHSLGEYVAATVAGVFSLEDALALVAARGKLMQTLDGGAMLAVALGEQQIGELLTPELALAAVNGPTTCVVSGSDQAIAGLAERLTAQGQVFRRLHVSQAFHSPLVEPILEEFRQQLQRISLRAPQLPIASNLTGGWLTAAEATSVDYWVQQARQPVRFADGLRSVLADGATVLLEVGPGQTLAALARRQIPAGVEVQPSLPHPQEAAAAHGEGLWPALAGLWLAGVELDWSAGQAGRGRVPLPTYPFERQRFWVEPPRPRSDAPTAAEPSLTESIAATLISQAETPMHPTAAATSARQEQICTTLTQTLHQLAGIDPSRLDPQASFFTLGVDSLLLLQVNQAVTDRYGIKISLRQLFEELSSLAALAAYIDAQLPPEPAPQPVASTPAAPAPVPSAAPAAPAPSMPQPVAAVVPDVAPAAPAPPALPPASEPFQAEVVKLLSQQLDVLRAAMGQPVPQATSLPTPAPQPAPPIVRAAAAEPAPTPRGGDVFVPHQRLALRQDQALEQRQADYLRSFVARYTARTAGSKRLAAAHRRALANNRSVAGFRLPWKELIYQIVAQRAEGARFWDVDGNAYIDISMGFGVSLFGHRPAQIEQALADELRRGAPIGPFSDTAGAVAELICELTGVERVAFFNSGTEAVMVALRLARAVTGREKIAVFAGSFHGTFDGILARAHTAATDGRAVPLAPGVPAHMAEHVLVLPYDSPEALTIIEAHAHELAAVLVEPVQSRRPDLQPRAFLHQLRALTARTGVALIFDEIISGFRIHPGGAQAHFGVQADLVTYGKVVGGGMPIGVVAGTAAYMDSIDGGAWQYGDASYPPHDERRTFVAGTFCQHPQTMAAALASLRALKAAGPALQQRLNERTARLADTLNAFFTAAHIPARVVHFGSLFRFVFQRDLELFFYHMIAKGVYIWEGRNCFLSTAHTDDDVGQIVRTVQESMHELHAGGFLPDMVVTAPAPAARNGHGQHPAVPAPQPALAVPAPQPAPAASSLDNAPIARRVALSLSFFGKYEAPFRDDKYTLLMEGARFADRAGLSAVWIPERHFHAFGGISPNPSVLAAAIAAATSRVQIRAGSVVLPLHHPVRVAEEWSVVDNLSGGRVGVSFASGWHSDDFVLAPQIYGQHREQMFEQITLVERLWRGEQVPLLGGSGQTVAVTLFPMPKQPALPMWLTVVRNAEMYRRAGALGMRILTNLMDQSIEELTQNIALYRQALREHGHAPSAGHVTVLLHTFLDSDAARAREQARQPFYAYLKSFLGLARNLARSQGVPIDLDKVPEADIEHVLAMAYERYVQSSALIGSPETCEPIVERLARLGVDEIACFVDFGVEPGMVLAGLDQLQKLHERLHTAAEPGTHLAGAQTIPLTDDQRQLWLLTQRGEDASSAYNEGVVLRLRGALQLDALRRAMDRLVARHDALRTTIGPDGEIQQIHPALAVELPLIDMTGVPALDREAAITGWLAEQGRRPFDLAQGPLVRVAVLKQADDLHLLAFLVHHIVADDWSRGVMLQELAALYSAASGGQPATLAPATPFGAFVAWQAEQARRSGPDVAEAVDFWRGLFATAPGPLVLPTARPRPAVPSYQGGRQRLTIEPARYAELKRAGAQQQCTVFITLLAAFNALLYRLTSQPRLAVGIPAAGQPIFGTPHLIGQCITMLPLVTTIDGEHSLAATMRALRGALLDIQQHQHGLPALAHAETTVAPPQLLVMFNMDRAISVPAFGELELELEPYPINYAKFDLAFNCAEIDGRLQIDVEYRSELFDDATIGWWIGAFEAITDALCTRPDTAIAALPLWGEEALRALVLRSEPSAQAAFVVDRRGALAPVGVIGELAVSAGQHAAPPDAGAPHPTEDGQTLVRTGIAARYTPQGAITTLGALDELVQRAGLPVAPADVAAVIAEDAAVAEAAVLWRADGSDEELIAYLVLSEPAGADAQTALGELHRSLRRRLPEDLLPAAFVLLGALPLGPDGTLDQARLRALAPSAVRPEALAAPATPTERRLAAVWAQVLRIAQIDTRDNFFELGGHSLLATTLVAQMRETFPVAITLRMLFDAPTVAAMAARIDEQLGAGVDLPSAAPLALPPIAPQPEHWDQPFALTDVQQAYWVGRSGAFGLGNISTHAYYEIDTTVDLERFAAAWRRLIDRHGMLRAVVRADGAQQILAEVPPYEIVVHDLRGLDREQVQERQAAIRARMSHQVIPSERWPLFEIQAARLDDTRSRLHISVDALIVDAWSMQILFGELSQCYHTPAADLVPLELSFRDYVLAEQALEQTEAYARAQRYWHSRLASLPPAPDLPLVKDPASLTQPHFTRWAGRLAPATWRQLKQHATKRGITPSMALLAAYAEVLTLWSKSPQFTINLTLFNRLPIHPQVNDIVGDFTSVTLLAIDNSGSDCFVQRARRTQEQLWEDLDHREVSGIRVLRELARMQRVTSGVLMPVVFTSSLIHDEGDMETSPIAWLGDVAYSVTQTPQVWLDHEVYEDAGALVYTWDVVDELFPAGMVQGMFDAFTMLIERLAHDADAWTAGWPAVAGALIPAADRALQEAMNRTAAPVSDALLHQLFAAQAAERPDHLAVWSPRATLTYAELARRSNQVGHRLRELGVLPNTLVAVVMEKGWEQVVAVLGILAAGGAYLPIDPSLPEARIAHLLDHGQVQVALTQSWVDESLQWPAHITRISLDGDALADVDAGPLQSVQQPDDLAYVIYTSGSTGQPKGVMIDHRGAVNTIADLNARLALGPGDAVLALSSLSFDLSVYDIFGLLAAGGTVVIPAAWSGRDPAHWAELMRQTQVTIWNTVPALMEMLVEYAAGLPGVLPASLRLVMMSGDWIPITLPERIHALLPEAQLLSLGGATEASIWSILHPIEAVDPAWKSIPYGRPMQNQTFHVLNEQAEPCPLWVPGQLYIGGIGLAKGYWRDEAKTNASFSVHPRSGERLYRTGDLGRMLPDGTIEFLGREDFQVKVQGHRIELGEIETALDQHPGVRAAVVTAVGELRKNKRLVAYIVPSQTPGASEPGGEAEDAGGSEISDPRERLAFKLGEPGLRREPDRVAIFLLPPDRDERRIEAEYVARRSYRSFARQPIPFAQFSAWLGALQQQRLEGVPLPRYRYGSAGSLYPVQVYLYLKPDAVEGIAEGTYYYNPREHSLVLLTQDAALAREIYDRSNQPVFDAAAFALFFVGQQQAIAPLYGAESDRFMTVEAGLMAQLLELSAPDSGIGLCQVGTLTFAPARQLFALEPSHTLIHSMLGGAVTPEQLRLEALRDEARESQRLIDMLALTPAHPPEQIAAPSSVLDPAALTEQLRVFLQQRLPEYMVPAAFVFMDALPLSSNGKVDRSALPDQVEAAAVAHVEPQSELEQLIAGLICSTLSVERIGIHDHFFDLGGNSIHLIQFHHKLEQALGRSIPIADMFKYTTVSALAQFLGHAKPAQTTDRSQQLAEGQNRFKQLRRRSSR